MLHLKKSKVLLFVYKNKMVNFCPAFQSINIRGRIGWNYINRHNLKSLIRFYLNLLCSRIGIKLFLENPQLKIINFKKENRHLWFFKPFLGLALWIWLATENGESLKVPYTVPLILFPLLTWKYLRKWKLHERILEKSQMWL